MILNFFLIITSVLVGSILSKILAVVLVYQRGINLFYSSLGKSIPSFNLALAQSKSLDILEFVFFVTISIGIYLILYYLYRRRNLQMFPQLLVGLGNIIFAALLYLSVVFASHSGTDTVASLFIWYLITFILSRFVPNAIPTWEEGKRSVFNGIIIGFYFLIFLNNFTTSVALPLAVFIITPLYFYIFAKKVKLLNNPSFIIPFLSFIFPYNKLALFGIAFVTGVIVFITRRKDFLKRLTFLEKIYPILILFIFIYNPTFYLGSFDSIEEGFWAGWLQRLLSGQFIYRDFAAYHPPLLTWGLFLFSKIFGSSLYNLRLYFHLLQILGLVVLFTVLGKLAKSKVILIGVFVLILAYGSFLVRDNIEIRVGSAILPLLFVYWYSLNKKNIMLFVAGVLASLALLVSVETGVSGIVAIVIATCFSPSRKKLFKNLLYVFLGGAAVAVVILGFLFVNGAMGKFIEYITYYAGAFSGGYMNIPIEQARSQTLVQWYLVVKYISSSGFLWELTTFSLVGGLLLVIYKMIKKNFGPTEILALGIAVFGIVLSRSALGRSDEYHIAFVWFAALLLISYVLQFFYQYSKEAVIAVLTLLIFFVCMNATQLSLIQNQLIKFETYGNVSGSYPSYTLPRAGILTGIDINTKDMDNLINYIDANTNGRDTIFVFPLNPEIYFLADRNNATAFDTPPAFYTDYYQNQIIEGLTSKSPKMIIYNTKTGPQNPGDSLYRLNLYIISNYKEVKVFGDQSVMLHI
jgi:hypothetical protein